jgi:hypothetical protein
LASAALPPYGGSSHPKIDEASTQTEGVAVFYLLSPHNAFMTTDINDKVLKNWAGA